MQRTGTPDPGRPLPAPPPGDEWRIYVTGAQVLERLTRVEGKVDVLIATGAGADHENRIRALERYAWSIPVSAFTAAAAIIIAAIGTFT